MDPGTQSQARKRYFVTGTPLYLRELRDRVGDLERSVLGHTDLGAVHGYHTFTCMIDWKPRRSERIQKML